MADAVEHKDSQKGDIKPVVGGRFVYDKPGYNAEFFTVGDEYTITEYDGSTIQCILSPGDKVDGAPNWWCRLEEITLLPPKTQIPKMDSVIAADGLDYFGVIPPENPATIATESRQYPDSILPGNSPNLVIPEGRYVGVGDSVNHPLHYNKGKIEVIEFIEDQNLPYHLANAVKYIGRARHKGTETKDLEKAIWYLRRYIEIQSDNPRRPNDMND